MSTSSRLDAPNRAIRRRLHQAYGRLKRRIVFDTLLYPYGVRRFRDVSRGAERSSTHTFTRFYRSPLQMEGLTGPVLEHVGLSRPPSALNVLVFGGSTGAEAYTVASALHAAHPSLDFEILSSDLHEEMIRIAAKGSYSEEEIRVSPGVTQAIIDRAFETEDGGKLRIREDIRSRVAFTQADLLSEDLGIRFKPADIVFLQNVLCHLDPKSAERAFRGVVKLLRPRSALFVDGMDLNLKVALTREYGLVPLKYRYREIFEHARLFIPWKWWTVYYGLEPHRYFVSDRVRRYSTIFLKGV